MTTNLLQIAGGLGLFLLGMVVMTDGLKGTAGDYLHGILTRFTHSPLSGSITGGISTAILQSSSATTVAAVGFVSAGLLTFTEALGIIFGANAGTTVTGWLVALFGLKFQIGSLTLPLVLLGVLLRLFGRGKLPHVGLAMAGFGLIFLGIDTLQDGLAAYRGVVTPEDFPTDSISGRLLLVLIGIAITLVTQSSSAGVATALTAVYTGAINFPQAAALVIGMDVGTTVTAAIATLGGSVDTRRTGYSHVIYNLMTGFVAFLLLTPYAMFWEAMSPGSLVVHAEIALVAFHSFFNLLGVAVVLPFASNFEQLIRRLVPEPADPLRDRLDSHLLKEPSAALDMAGHTVQELVIRIFGATGRTIAEPGVHDYVALRGDLDATHAFVDQIHLQRDASRDWRRLNALIHILDHLQRLLERCEEEPERAMALHTFSPSRVEADAMADQLQSIATLIASGNFATISQLAAAAESRISTRRGALRTDIMAEIAQGLIDVPTGTARVEGVRWLLRVGTHAARICRHLTELDGAGAVSPRAGAIMSR